MQFRVSTLNDGRHFGGAGAREERPQDAADNHDQGGDAEGREQRQPRGLPEAEPQVEQNPCADAGDEQHHKHRDAAQHRQQPDLAVELHQRLGDLGGEGLQLTMRHAGTP